MKTTVRTVGQVSVVDLSGKITIGEGDVVLRDKVLELLDAGHSKILLSLEKVACFKKAREKGGTVKLLKPSGKVEDLLQLTKLWEVFEIFDEEAPAVASF
jgi:anti-sigma B factor antagonist